MRTRVDPRGAAAGATSVSGVPVRWGREPLIVGGLALAATVYVALVDPNQPGHYLTCPLLAATGLYCPGCGGLRAVHDLARLDVVGAWAMNPLLVVVMPFAALGWARWLRWSRTRGRMPTMRSIRRNMALAWTVLVVVLAFAVLRNVPALAPWLAP